MTSEFSAAFSAEPGAGRILGAARRALAGLGLRCVHRRAAIVAELDGLGIFRAAAGALFQVHRSAAVVAEFAVAGGLAAGLADGGLALDLAFPDGGRLAGFVDVASHRFGAGLGDVDLLAGRALGAEALVFVETGVADVMIAGMTAVKMLRRLVLSALESCFVLLLPFGTHAVEALGYYIAAAFDGVANVAECTADEAAKEACALCQVADALALLVRLRLDEGALVPVVTGVTAESEGESGLCGIVLVVSCEGFQHFFTLLTY